MKLPFGRLLPGENTRLLVVAASIGLAAGLLIIAFRESLAWMHQHFFLAGQQLLGTGQGGWQLLLLPLLPLCGMLLLIPLALLGSRLYGLDGLFAGRLVSDVAAAAAGLYVAGRVLRRAANPS